MIGVLVGMTLAIIALVVLLAILADQIIRLNAGTTEDQRVDHAICMSHVTDVASRRIVAMAVRDLAERYETPTGQRELTVIRSQWAGNEVEGRSIPAAWLLAQAERIEETP